MDTYYYLFYINKFYFILLFIKSGSVFNQRKMIFLTKMKIN
jgi:hypothetical protein